MSEANKEIEAMTYKPSEIIGTVKAWLMRQNEIAKMVLVEGVYKPKTDIARYAYCYDLLIDESSGEEITLVMPRNLRMDLVNHFHLALSHNRLHTLKILLHKGRCNLPSDLRNSPLPYSLRTARQNWQ